MARASCVQRRQIARSNPGCEVSAGTRGAGNSALLIEQGFMTRSALPTQAGSWSWRGRLGRVGGGGCRCAGHRGR
jgi:hypothetical protein